MTEDEIRASERERIAKHLSTVADALLHDKTSDGVDRYVAAVLLDLASTIRRNL